jgi:hypothetical protein
LSNIRATTISGLNGTDPVTLTRQVAIKATCSWEADQANQIYSSFNQSSLTDESTGKWRVNFTNSFASQNDIIAVPCFQRTGSNGEAVQHVFDQSTAAQCTIEAMTNATLQDKPVVQCVVEGDLA